MFDLEEMIEKLSGKNFCIMDKTRGTELFVKKEESLESTNTALKFMAPEYPFNDFLLIAREQTGGRGRLGRSFQSPAGGIYMSLLLHPDMPAEDSLFLTTAAAVAVSESIEQVCGRQTGIKWVNDIFLGNQKICGILTEAKITMESKNPEYAVVGIGINVEAPEQGFTEDIKTVAGAIYEYGRAPEQVYEKLIANIVCNFYKYYNTINTRSFFDEYKRRSCLMGREVKVVDNIFNPGQYEIATVIDIDEKCHLIVKDQNGTVKSLSSGEVSIRLEN
ncbi:MAG: biotin--[acetyl-CoA-carboxylase] ligase [Lachnospiraceae bacterium]